MKILLHPKIDWDSWQRIKQSALFRNMSWGEQVCLIDTLPLKLWQREMADGQREERVEESMSHAPSN